MRRLRAPLPGRIAGPLRPPSRASAYVASDRPPFLLSWLWHSRQWSAMIGCTCRSKSIIALRGDWVGRGRDTAATVTAAVHATAPTAIAAPGTRLVTLSPGRLQPIVVYTPVSHDRTPAARRRAQRP